MLFLTVPGLLVILELSSRLVMESKLLGGLSLVAGIGLVALLVIHVVSFRKEDQEFMRSFVIVFLVFFLIITIGKLVSDNTLQFNQVLERYKNSFKTYIKMFEEGASKASYTTSEASFHSTFDSVAWDMADDDSDDIHYTDAETIIENQAGNHTQLTLFSLGPTVHTGPQPATSGTVRQICYMIIPGLA